MLNNNDLIEKYLTEDVVKEILRYLRLNKDNKEKVLSSLRILNNCVQNENTVDYVTKNKVNILNIS